MTDNNRIVEAFAKALIVAPKDMGDAEEKRLQIAGFFMPHAFFVQNCAADGQYNSIPYFNLVNNDKLPSGNVVEYSGLRDEHPEYKLAARTSEEKLRAAVDSVFEASLEGKTLTKVNGVSDAVGSNADGFDHRGSRTPVSYGEPIIKRTRFSTTSGDHYAAKKLHDASEGTPEKELWHLFQEILLVDKNNIPPKDWLRQLRLLSGKRIQDMGMALGLKDASGSNYSNFENGTNIKVRYIQTILDKNLLDLPVDTETGKVRDDIRTKFTRKFERFSGETEQIAAAVKAMAIEHARHIAHGGKPEDSDIAKLEYNRPEILLELMKRRNTITSARNGGRVSVRHVRKEFPELQVPENGDYLNLLPSKKHDHILFTDPELSCSIAKNLTLEIAEHSPNLSSFLKRYQQIHGKLMKDIAVGMSFSRTRVSQLLKGDDSLSFREIECHDSKNIRGGIVERIISTNAFDLPAGEDGKVHHDVAEAVIRLHNNEKIHIAI